MSIRTVNSSSSGNAGLNTKTLSNNQTDWVRNPQWIALPTVLPTEQKFVGLNAIFPLSNFIALVAAGDYTVNWGDGVTENFTANTVAYHIYDYTNSAFDGTLTDLGYKQAIVTVTPQAGQNLTYLSLNQRHNQTNLQAYASGFLDIAISSEELTDLKISVSTPSSASPGVINFNLLEQVSLINSDCKQLGNLFYSCKSLQSIPNFVTSPDPAVTKAVTFTDTGDLITSASHGFRNGDVVIFTSITSTTGITVGTAYYIINATTDTFQVSITYGGSAVALTTNGTGVALYGTSFLQTFNFCNALKTVPLFNTSNVTTMYGMFNNCTALETLPLFNTASVINMNQMFFGCRSLLTVPLFNTASVIDMSNMFTNCSNLQTVPLFNTSAVTTMGSMLSGCSALTSVPLFNTVNVINMGALFSGCSALQTVPLFNTANVTAMNSMFYNCFSLQTVPLFNTSNVTTMQQMFGFCGALQKIPLFDTAKVTTMQIMFSNCSSLSSIPALAVTAVTNFNTMFTSCQSLTRIEAKDFKISFNIASGKLSGTALDEIYTNLPTVTGQTITVTNNYGTSSDTPSIATAKGWTVTG